MYLRSKCFLDKPSDLLDRDNDSMLQLAKKSDLPKLSLLLHFVVRAVFDVLHGTHLLWRHVAMLHTLGVRKDILCLPGRRLNFACVSKASARYTRVAPYANVLDPVCIFEDLVHIF